MVHQPAGHLIVVAVARWLSINLIDSPEPNLHMLDSTVLHSASTGDCATSARGRRLLHMPIAEYRAYVVGLDGHFINYTEFVARDDGEAFQKTKQLVDGYAVELWSGERFVKKFDPKEPD
jgi:hypothetical protein